MKLLIDLVKVSIIVVVIAFLSQVAWADDNSKEDDLYGNIIDGFTGGAYDLHDIEVKHHSGKFYLITFDVTPDGKTRVKFECEMSDYEIDLDDFSECFDQGIE